MRRARLLLLFAALGSPAAAAPDWRQAREYDVLLSSFDIQPPAMNFRAGEPLRLRLINNSGETHSFSAKGFFNAAEVRSRERKAIGNGSVSVGPGETREILIVPKAGRYSARCSNLFHHVMGMRARIVVE